jgi:hypothetical protein
MRFEGLFNGFYYLGMSMGSCALARARMVTIRCVALLLLFFLKLILAHFYLFI